MMKSFATSYDNFKTPKVAGVYTITNNVNNKVYIGETVNLGNRFSDHISDLIHGIHCNKNLQKDFTLYGIHNFSFRILKVINNNCKNNSEIVNTLLYLESAYYRKYEKDYDFYNIVIPYKEIDKEKVDMPNYTIDYNIIKCMLNNDPFNIGYDKINWTPTPPPALTLKEILNNKADYDADKFEKAICNSKLKKQLLSFMATQKYIDTQRFTRRMLLCILREIGNVVMDDVHKDFRKAFLNDNIDSKYVYQSDDITAKMKKIYLNCQKPIILSYQAQTDIIEYLKNFNQEQIDKLNCYY